MLFYAVPCYTDLYAARGESARKKGKCSRTMNLLTKLFGSYSKKELKRIEPLKQAVLALDDKYTKMTDEELKGQTAVLKERLSLGSSLDDILPEALSLIHI